MTASAPAAADKHSPRTPVVIFGIGIALFVLYLLTIAIGFSRKQNDFVAEAWGPYRLLAHGHVIGFIRTGPAYIGSLILRAPFALVAALFGAGVRGTYIATALPCVICPAVLAAWVSPDRRRTQRAPGGRHRRIWPLDVFMLTPPAWLAINGGHPEDILGAVLCVAAVLLAQRGSARAAGAMLGLALINKSWAAVAVPLVFVLMPADRRLEGFVTAVATAGFVLVPVEFIRMTGSGGSGTGLGGGTGSLFLVPQLWWFIGKNSWFAREAHFILVAVCWLATATWWWFCIHRLRERPSAELALLMLALILFLRAALDPWDNAYYFAPFMLAVMAYEDRGGFPLLSWTFAITVLIIVPIAGVLKGLGQNGHAAVFAAWALATIAYFARRAFSPTRAQRAAGRYAAAGHAGA